MKRDYYSLLGVDHFASQDAIKHAFHSRILLVHPDKNPTDSTAVDRSRELIEAYKILADSQSRHAYDRASDRPAAAVVACGASGCSSSSWLTKTVVVGLFLAMSIGMVFGVADVMANRTPVFRPYLGVIDVSADDHAPLAVVAAPDLASFREWYAAQQYQMSMASDSATRNLMDVYSEAARNAARHGNADCAQFYTRCIAGIQNAGPSVVL